MLEVKVILTCHGTFFKAVPVGLMKQLSFRQFIDKCHGQRVLMCFSKTMIEKRFGNSNLIFIDGTKVQSALASISLERLWKVAWYAHGSSDLFSFEYNTWKRSRGTRSAPMAWNLDHETMEKISGTKTARPTYRGESFTGGMLLDFANATWQHRPDKKVDYFEIAFHQPQDMFH